MFCSYYENDTLCFSKFNNYSASLLHERLFVRGVFHHPGATDAARGYHASDEDGVRVHQRSHYRPHLCARLAE